MKKLQTKKTLIKYHARYFLAQAGKIIRAQKGGKGNKLCTQNVFNCNIHRILLLYTLYTKKFYENRKGRGLETLLISKSKNFGFCKVSTSITRPFLHS